jgi:hypothetical protein
VTPPVVQAGRAVRIRIGVTLVVVSWLPIAQLAVWITAASGHTADTIRAVIWGVQIAIGFAGVALAGTETIKVAKSVGWRRSPGVIWRLIRAPNTPIAPS